MLKATNKGDVKSRQARAELNKALQPCASEDAFRVACKDFQQRHGGRAIWDAKTYHNDDETFGILAQVHLERVTANDAARSPEGIVKWIALLLSCSVGEFTYFESAFSTSDFLRDNQDAHDAIHKRGRELGIEGYTDE